MSDYNDFLSQWKSRKLKEICRIINLFTTYLLIPRDGYMKYNDRTITSNVVKYVIEDFYNCDSKKSQTECNENFKREVNKSFPNCVVENDVYNHLWNYIDNLVNSLTENISPNELLEKIEYSSKLSNYNKKLRKYTDIINDSSILDILRDYNNLYIKLLNKDKKINLDNRDIEILTTEGISKDDTTNNILNKLLSGFIFSFIKKNNLFGYNYQNQYDKIVNNKNYKDLFIDLLINLNKNFNDKFILDSLKKYNNLYKKLKDERRNINQKLYAFNTNMIELDDKEIDILKSLNISNDDISLLKKYKSLQEDLKHKVKEEISKIPSDDIEGKKKLKLKLKIEYRDNLYPLLNKTKLVIDSIFDIIDNSKIYNLIKNINIFDESNKDRVFLSIEKQFQNLKDTGRKQIFINIVTNLELKDNDENLKKTADNNSYFLLIKRIKESEDLVANHKCDKIEGIFDDSFDNCFINALSYILIAISDWLEIDIGKDEIKLALSIILPENKIFYIDENISDENEEFNKYLSKLLLKNGIRSDMTHFFYISEMLKTIKKDEKNFNEINNRIKFFSTTETKKTYKEPVIIEKKKEVITRTNTGIIKPYHKDVISDKERDFYKKILSSKGSELKEYYKKYINKYPMIKQSENVFNYENRLREDIIDTIKRKISRTNEAKKQTKQKIDVINSSDLESLKAYYKRFTGKNPPFVKKEDEKYISMLKKQIINTILKNYKSLENENKIKNKERLEDIVEKDEIEFIDEIQEEFVEY